MAPTSSRSDIQGIYPEFEGEIDNIEEDFTSHYIGNWDTLEDWAHERIESEGWLDALCATADCLGMPDQMIQLDVQPLLAMAHDSTLFSIVYFELLGLEAKEQAVPAPPLF